MTSTIGASSNGSGGIALVLTPMSACAECSLLTPLEQRAMLTPKNADEFAERWSCRREGSFFVETLELVCVAVYGALALGAHRATNLRRSTPQSNHPSSHGQDYLVDSRSSSEWFLMLLSCVCTCTSDVRQSLTLAFAFIVGPTNNQAGIAVPSTTFPIRRPPNARFTVRDGFHLHQHNQQVIHALDEQLTLLAPEEEPEEQDQEPNQANPPPTKAATATATNAASPGDAALDHHEDRKDSNRRVSRSNDPVVDSVRDAAANHRTSLMAQRQRQDTQETLARSVADAVLAATSKSTLNRHTSRHDSIREWLIYRRETTEYDRHGEIHLARLLKDEGESREPCPAHYHHLDGGQRRTPTPPSSQGPTTSSKPGHCCARAHRSFRVVNNQRRPTASQDHKTNPPLEDISMLAALEEYKKAGLETSENKELAEKVLRTLFERRLGDRPPVKRREIQLKYPTRKATMIVNSAVVVKEPSLETRIEEYRSVPQVVEQLLTAKKRKYRESVAKIGVDFHERNKSEASTAVPSRNKVILPSIVEFRHEQAIQRKAMHDELRHQHFREVADRWQRKKMTNQERDRVRYQHSQLLLTVSLSLSCLVWIDRINTGTTHNNPALRDAMARRIQRMWRRKYHRITMFHFARSVGIIHRFARRTVYTIRRKRALFAVHVIVTSWFEFQDAKFRRVIWRFRSCVREFQTRWRGWKAVTEARIRLLLLVWARVEKKLKQQRLQNHHHNSGGFGVGHHGLQLHGNTSPSVATLPGLVPVSLPIPDLRDVKMPNSAERRRYQKLQQANELLMNSVAFIDAVHSKPGMATMSLTPPSTSSMTNNNYSNPSSSPIHSSPGKRASILASAPTTPTNSSSSPVANRNTRRLSVGLNALALMASSATGPRHFDKAPLSVKIALLRQLLSNKRRAFREDKEKRRRFYDLKSQNLRRVDYRYNLLDEMEAYHRFRQETSVFLMLRSISDLEIAQLIQEAENQVDLVATMGATGSTGIGNGAGPKSLLNSNFSVIPTTPM